MGKDYSGLDVNVALGGMDVNFDVAGVHRTAQLVGQLQRGNQVSYAKVDQSLDLVKSSMRHPTYARSSSKVVEAIYNLADGVEEQAPQIQAHVIGQLIGEHNDVALNLLNQSDEVNHLRQSLGDQGVQRLQGIMEQQDQNDRVCELVDWCLGGKVAYRREDENPKVLDTPAGMPTDTNRGTPWMKAVMSYTQDSDLEPVKAEIDRSLDPVQLGQDMAAELGEQARPMLEALLVKLDPDYSTVGFQGILHLESNLAQTAQSGATLPASGGQAEEQRLIDVTIDAAALRSRLMDDANSLPYNNLAASFGCSPAALQAGLLELIVSD